MQKSLSLPRTKTDLRGHKCRATYIFEEMVKLFLLVCEICNKLKVELKLYYKNLMYLPSFHRFSITGHPCMTGTGMEKLCSDVRPGKAPLRR